MRRVEIGASTNTVWALLADVTAWPSWTPTMTMVEADGPAALGRFVTVTQPRMRPVVYIIDSFSEGRSFRWSAKGRTTTAVADHQVEALDETRCIVTLSFEMTGLIGAPMGRLGAARIVAMVDLEAVSLKKVAEAGLRQR